MRTLVAALVGMIIIFAYQALSWMALPTHKSAFTYTKDQDAIMTVLSQHLSESGVYAIPSVPPDATMQQHEDMMKQMDGKPQAIINYHTSVSANMVPKMIFGLVFNLVCILLVIMVINRGSTVFATFGSRLALVMTFGIFLVFGGPMMSWNWWGYPTNYVIADVFDMIVGWLLCGLWLAWYLGRNRSAE